MFSTTFNNISTISWRSVYWWRKPEDPEKATDTVLNNAEFNKIIYLRFIKKRFIWAFIFHT